MSTSYWPKTIPRPHLQTLWKNVQPKDFIAGTCAGITGVFIGYPFDLVKVRLQTQTQRANFSGTFDCFRKTIHFEGIRGLYKGMAAPIAGDAFTNCCVFGIFQIALKTIHKDPTTPPRFHEVFLSGNLAGMAGALVLAPIELIKARLQIQGKATGVAQTYRGPLHLITKTIQEEGLTGLWRGSLATACRTIPSFGIYFSSYFQFKKLFGITEGDARNSKVVQQFVSGGLAGVATWSVVYPIDSIKNRLQVQRKAGIYYNGLAECFWTTIKTEGAAALYKGLPLTLARAFPVNATIFGTYELFLRGLDYMFPPN